MCHASYSFGQLLCLAKFLCLFLLLDPNFKWEGAGSKLFGGKDGKTDRQNEDADEDGSGAEEPEEENSGIHFAPIVQLPEVEVKTGEEDEDDLFRERAKLYRFDNGQWKERGIGDMKILRNRVNGEQWWLFSNEIRYFILMSSGHLKILLSFSQSVTCISCTNCHVNCPSFLCGL